MAVLPTRLNPALWAADRSRVDPALGEVALVVMPFSTIMYPSIAVGQIQAQLLASGLSAFSAYINVEFAERFGIQPYELIARRRGVDVQLGEWLFAEEAWDGPPAMDEAAFCAIAEAETQTLRTVWDDPLTAILDTRRTLVPAFLDTCAHTLAARSSLRAVGFSCMFSQTLPSIALARRLKQLRPDIKVAFGGPSFHADMGREYMEALPFADAVCLGEGDRTVVPLFHALAAGRAPEGLGDVLWREELGGAIIDGGPPDLANGTDLDALPDPEYENYFRALRRFGFLNNPDLVNRLYLPVETSRGCWWGQIKHCTFCGLNGLGMTYRAKSPERARTIIEGAYTRWGIPRLMAVDNILPQQYFDTLLPALQSGSYGGDISLWYEIKSNISRKKVEQLVDAGVDEIVPGIESLSTNILKRIDKGVTALNNVFALKMFGEYGINAGWGMLIRAPGERAEDYTDMATLIPKIVHLQPPYGGPRPIEMHRFSPYHARAAEFSDSHTPQPWYAGLFPKGAVALDRVAYYFDADWRDVTTEQERAPLVDAVWRWVEAWRERPEPPQLWWLPQPDGTARIADTRTLPGGTFVLDVDEAKLFATLADPISRSAYHRAAGTAGIDQACADTILERFLSHDLAIEMDGKILALALSARRPAQSLQSRRQVLSRPGQQEQIAAAKAARESANPSAEAQRGAHV